MMTKIDANDGSNLISKTTLNNEVGNYFGIDTNYVGSNINTNAMTITMARNFEPIFIEILGDTSDIISHRVNFILFSKMDSDRKMKFFKSLLNPKIATIIETFFHASNHFPDSFPYMKGKVAFSVVSQIVAILTASEGPLKDYSAEEKFLFVKYLDYFLRSIGLIQHTEQIRMQYTIDVKQRIMSPKNFLVEMQYHWYKRNTSKVIFPKPSKPSRPFGTTTLLGIIADFFGNLSQALQLLAFKLEQSGILLGLVKLYHLNKPMLVSKASKIVTPEFELIANNYTIMSMALSSTYMITFDTTVDSKFYHFVYKSGTGDPILKTQNLPDQVDLLINIAAAVIKDPPIGYKTMPISVLPSMFKSTVLHDRNDNKLLYRKFSPNRINRPDNFHSVYSIMLATGMGSKLFSGLSLYNYRENIEMTTRHKSFIESLRSGLRTTDVDEAFKTFLKIGTEITKYKGTDYSTIPSELKLPLALSLSQSVQYIAEVSALSDDEIANLVKEANANRSPNDKEVTAEEVKKSYINLFSKYNLGTHMIYDNLTDFLGITNEYTIKGIFKFRYLQDSNFSVFPFKSADYQLFRKLGDSIYETVNLDYFYSTVSGVAFTATDVLVEDHDEVKDVLSESSIQVIGHLATKSQKLEDVKYKLKYLKKDEKNVFTVVETAEHSVEKMISFLMLQDQDLIHVISRRARDEHKDAIVSFTSFGEYFPSANQIVHYKISDICKEIYNDFVSNEKIRQAMITYSSTIYPFSATIFESIAIPQPSTIIETIISNLDTLFCAIHKYYFDIDIAITEKFLSLILETDKNSAVISYYSDFIGSRYMN